MRTVPGQEEVHVLARVLELSGEVDGHGESRVAVACTMTNVPMGSHREAGTEKNHTNLLHKVYGVFRVVALVSAKTLFKC